jgi:transcriptional regulator with XRE-family HTH domain
MININPDQSAQARFSYELRRHRIAAGMTQSHLGRRVGFSGSMIGMIETMRRVPPPGFAELCDQIFHLDGTLTRLHLDAWPPPPPLPSYLLDWAVEEQRATALRSWDPLLIPGMFQTEAYARRIFQRSPGVTDEEVEQRVEGRLQRKAILSKPDPPSILSLIDEGVLRRRIGDPQVMRQQLEHLLEIARRPCVTIQIVPYEAEAVPGLLAGFTIAEVRGAPYRVHMESQPYSRTIDDRSMIEPVLARYDAIRAEAYPQPMSIKIIKEAVDQWI